MAEDRERFRDLLDRIGQPYAPSVIVEGADEAERAAATARALEDIGLPAIVRPAFTLGGTGGGIVADRGRVPRARAGRPAPQPHRPGHGRALPGRLAGDRVRGHARRGRHVHRGVLHGERRPARRAHRRLHRRGAGPDAARPGPPAAAHRGPRHHPGARRGGRLQRPVRALARRLASTPSSRSTRASAARRRWPPRRPATPSPGWPPRSPSAAGWTRSPTPSRAARWPPSSRPSTTSS